MRFAIVDIETTGSHAKGHGITEIAVIISDGSKILERWETLVDPGEPIPNHIVQLTGITDDMVRSAPTFESIADELEDWLKEAVFVAHNVGFDYAFIRGHFEAMGRIWRRPKLCTVRMARKLLPGHNSYSLGNICRDLDISNGARHRAMGDCAATVELFHRMMQNPGSAEIISNMLKRGERESWLPQHVPASDFENLPATPGVYQFLDRKGSPIYIGMSHNIRHRVRSHFNGSMKSSRRQAFLRDIYRIQCEPTGSALMARLIEDESIRKHWPIHNRAQKSVPIRIALVSYLDQRGAMRLHLKRQRNNMHAIRWFRKEEDARAWLHSMAAKHELNPELLGLGSDGRPTTFSNSDIERHNDIMNELMREARTISEWAIIDRGRTPEEYAVVLMENEQVKGWGYSDDVVSRFEQIHEIVDIKSSSATCDAIVQHALSELQAGKARFKIIKADPALNIEV